MLPQEEIQTFANWSFPRPNAIYLFSWALEVGRLVLLWDPKLVDIMSYVA